jgi:hypothetical protein
MSTVQVAGREAGRVGASYPAYFDSNIEGVSQLPDHWRIKPLKHVVDINPEELSDGQ